MNTQDFYSEPVDDFKGGYQYGRRYTRGAGQGLLRHVVICIRIHTYTCMYSCLKTNTALDEQMCFN